MLRSPVRLPLRSTSASSSPALSVHLPARSSVPWWPARYSSDELARAVCSVRWPGQLDPVFGMNIPHVGKHFALMSRRDLYKGNQLEGVWRDMLQRKVS